MKKIFEKKYVWFILFTIAGIFIGWLIFRVPLNRDSKHDHPLLEAAETTWTCAMHPQIRMPSPGKCPICGMDLIPLEQGKAEEYPGAVHLTKEAAALADVLTSPVTQQKPVKEIRLYGKIKADERLIQSQTSHISGRIEKLYVNFTGEEVKKGQPMALVYSPELVTAQQELLEAAKMKQLQPEIYEAAKERLRHRNLTEEQITSIENSGSVRSNFDIVSNTSGIITARRVNDGQYISRGDILYEVADLSYVWAMFDAYESDLPFISKGDKIAFSVQAMPGVIFTGNIVFVDPVIDPVTRIAEVRVEVPNPNSRLKPGMFATGIITANLNQYRDKLVIPRSAVLWTGKRSIVYVKPPGTEEPVFLSREIELGPMLGDSYIVISGLTEGEEIVTRGTFSVDAAAQLEGKPSMMNPDK